MRSSVLVDNSPLISQLTMALDMLAPEFPDIFTQYSLPGARDVFPGQSCKIKKHLDLKELPNQENIE